MSLDVYLTLPGAHISPPQSRIFIREDGATKEISRAEWDARFPGREPVTVQGEEETDAVYSANITHNLRRMAQKAGLYGICWQPELCAITHAGQLVLPLHHGLVTLRRDPDYFAQWNPTNGWGTYAGLCQFVEGYLAACAQYGAAVVSVSR